jgi:manganese transport protein
MTPRGDAFVDPGARATDEPQVARAPAPANSRGAGRFLGPALLVSVGYMDPGNWATDLEGGARFGYDLLWVLIASSLIALLLQNLCARLGVVTGLNLASACQREFSRPVSFTLWILAELGIIACDLAEVLGSAVALHLLFGVPVLAGALLTSFDVLLILMLQQRGMRKLEAFVLTLLSSVGVCMLVELWFAKPSIADVAGGLQPRLNGDSLYLAIGILGATVMPHNLYLHSALVPHVSVEGRQQALRRNFWSTGLALNLALVVNAAILILAASVFWARGLPVDDLRDAHRLLSPLLGTGLASALFALGLLCAGQSASVSGTLAGQIVMEGFLQLRLSPLMRRALTRGLAIVPAVGVLAVAGDSALMALLVGSQIVLSLQLPFAIVPLIKLTRSRSLMGPDANRTLSHVCATACACLIVVANLALVARTVAQAWHSVPALSALLAVAGVASLGFLARVATVSLRSDTGTSVARDLAQGDFT